MTKIISVNYYDNMKVAVIRSGVESFEIIINTLTGITEVWKAQYKKMGRGYEKEIFPKLLISCESKILANKYNTPKHMINNYMLTGII